MKAVMSFLMILKVLLLAEKVEECQTWFWECKISWKKIKRSFILTLKY